MSTKAKFYIILAFISIVAIGIVLVFTCQKKSSNSPITEIRDIAQLEDIYASWPSLSSDQKTLRYFDLSSKKLKSLDLATGKTEDLFDESFNKVFNISWSPQETLIVFQDFNNSVTSSLIDLSTGTKTSIEIGNPISVVWANDGSRFAYSNYKSTDYKQLSVKIASDQGKTIGQTDPINVYGSPTKLAWQNNTLKFFKASYIPPESTKEEQSHSESIVYNIDSSRLTLQQGDFDTNINDLVFANTGQYAAAVIDGGITNLFIYNNNQKHPIDLFISSLSSLVFDKNNDAYVVTDNKNSEQALVLYKIDLANYSANKIKEFDLPKIEDKELFIKNIMIADKKLIFIRNNLLYVLPI